jgi:hypothetical protein
MRIIFEFEAFWLNPIEPWFKRLEPWFKRLEPGWIR